MVVEVVFFLDGQRVHIGTQTDHAATGAGPEDTDHAGLAHPGVSFDAQGTQAFGHNGGGAVLLEGKLRMGVDIPTDGTDFGLIGPQFFKKVHDASR